MKRCRDCHFNISDRGNRAVRCISCQKRYRNFVKHISGSARANKHYYTLWKFLTESKFSVQELQILFLKRKTDCKGASSKERKKLKTEMMIINEATIKSKFR